MTRVDAADLCKQVLELAREDTSLVFSRSRVGWALTLDRVRLTRARLPVSKQRRVVALNAAVHNRSANCLVHLILRDILASDEVKCVLLAFACGVEDHSAAVNDLPNASLGPSSATFDKLVTAVRNVVALRERSHSNDDLHVLAAARIDAILQLHVAMIPMKFEIYNNGLIMIDIYNQS